MKLQFYSLAIVLGIITTSALAESSSSRPSPITLSDSIKITTNPIYAIYTHGESPAEISSTYYVVTNNSETDISLTLTELISIETDREGKERSEKLILTQLSSPDGGLFENFVVLLAANASIELLLEFEPLSVEVFYYRSYRALRLNAKYDGIKLTCDAKLEVTREEPYDYDKLNNE